jgi:hypothetical protein
MTTPHERLSRMRASFEKDRSVSADDYRYFATPDKPTKPRASTPQSKAARKSEELSVLKSPKQS